MTHNREDVTDYGILFIIGFIALCAVVEGFLYYSLDLNT